MHMNVEGVSVIHVKSHLQKHRLKMKEQEEGGGGGGSQARLRAPPRAGTLWDSLA